LVLGIHTDHLRLLSTIRTILAEWPRLLPHQVNHEGVVHEDAHG